MPIFKVDVEKQKGTEFWTNRYLINDSDLAAASEAAVSVIVPAERAFHPVSVLFTKVRASTPAEGDGQFITTPINLAGLVDDVNQSPLPLFNTLRVDFPAGFGRPSRKYYRGMLNESNTQNGGITAALASTAQEALESMLLSIALVDPQGTLLTSTVIYPFIQMRQMRRGSKRKTTPVIP